MNTRERITFIGRQIDQASRKWSRLASKTSNRACSGGNEEYSHYRQSSRNEHIIDTYCHMTRSGEVLGLGFYLCKITTQAQK